LAPEAIELEKSRRSLFERIRHEIHDTRVIEAMEHIPREIFVRNIDSHLAYEDIPLLIGEGQTISQPFIIALMLSALAIRQSDRVLEVGTGSGYQAAILSKLAKVVITVERVSSLAESAQQRLQSQGYNNIEVVTAGKELGWPARAPYDCIVVAAAAPKIPNSLVTQLKIGGRMIIPVGSQQSQDLLNLTRTADYYTTQTMGACRFVPLIGTEAWPDI